MVNRGEAIGGLELCKTQVKCVIGTFVEAQIMRVVAASMPYSGVEGDTDDAVSAVTQLMETCAEQAQQEVKGVYLGIRGVHSAADIFRGTSSVASMAMNVVTQAGFFVIDLVNTLDAVGQLLLSSKESKSGCLVLDFGGEMLSAGIFHKGSLQSSLELHLGSEILSRDIAGVLEIPIHAAQILKKRASLFKNEDGVNFQDIDGHTMRRVTTRTLFEIIQPRIEEIFSLIRKYVKRSKYAKSIAINGAVLTGGGALLKGLPEAASKFLKIPVRLGVPRKKSFIISTDFNVPIFATALGLVNYAKLRIRRK